MLDQLKEKQRVLRDLGQQLKASPYKTRLWYVWVKEQGHAERLVTDLHRRFLAAGVTKKESGATELPKLYQEFETIWREMGCLLHDQSPPPNYALPTTSRLWTFYHEPEDDLFQLQRKNSHPNLSSLKTAPPQQKEEEEGNSNETNMMALTVYDLQRSEQICQVRDEVFALHAIMQDLAQCVSQQQPQLDLASACLDKTVTEIKQAEQEQEQEQKHRPLLRLGFIGAAVGLMVGGPIGVAIGSKLFFILSTGGGAVMGVVTSRFY